jgi:hypothetical protein
MADLPACLPIPQPKEISSPKHAAALFLSRARPRLHIACSPRAIPSARVVDLAIPRRAHPETAAYGKPPIPSVIGGVLALRARRRWPALVLQPTTKRQNHGRAVRWEISDPVAVDAHSLALPSSAAERNVAFPAIIAP